jgi:RNA polymerase sigma-70 factor (ECF subfamily)
MDAFGPLTDELLREARAGDADARARLLEAYRSYLTLLARVQLGRPVQSKLDPSDLVQEAFLEAHRDFHQFQGETEAELRAWLRRLLVHNLANQIRRYRTKRRDFRLEQQLAAELDQSSHTLEHGLIAPDSSPSARAVRREESLRLAEALERLPAEAREVLLLRHFQGLTFPAIARGLGKSLGSVKNTWLRGLAQLRHALEEEL